jgi:hypothetical protein
MSAAELLNHQFSVSQCDVLVKAERKNLLNKLSEALILINLVQASDSIESKHAKAGRGVRYRPRRAGGNGKY